MNKKRIKLKYGCVRKLAKECNVNERTVNDALNYKSDSLIQGWIRTQAKRKGYIRQF